MSTKSVIERQQNKIILQIVSSIMAIGMAERTANGQTTNAPSATADSGGSTNVTQLENVTVVGKLDTARNQIVPDLGATVYTIDKKQIVAKYNGLAAQVEKLQGGKP